jgi:hypothetical protein
MNATLMYIPTQPPRTQIGGTDRSAGPLDLLTGTYGAGTVAAINGVSVMIAVMLRELGDFGEYRSLLMKLLSTLMLGGALWCHAARAAALCSSLLDQLADSGARLPSMKP